MDWTSDWYDEEKSIQLPTTRLMVSPLRYWWAVEEDDDAVTDHQQIEPMVNIKIISIGN